MEMDRLDDMPPVPSNGDRPRASTAPPTVEAGETFVMPPDPSPSDGHVSPSDGFVLPPHPPAPRRPYRPSRADFARAVGTIFVAVLATGMHDQFVERSGFRASTVLIILVIVAASAVTASTRILSGRCVGIVPTLIICSTVGISLATIAYGIGEHVARWLT